jgi:type I restriction enzyme R subunit/putative DNA methylase
VQLVTLRLVDSLPASRRGEWEHLLKIEDVRERRTKLEEYLDRGVGKCHLRDPCIAKLCEDALLFFHNERYELLAWCVMPNHVHVLVLVWRTPLWKLIAAWKKRVGAQALEMLRPERRSPDRPVDAPSEEPIGRSALRAFWQREYWDTFIRSTEQEKTAIRFVESNPAKAKLCRTAEDWLFSSVRFRDRYRRLVLPAKT